MLIVAVSQLMGEATVTVRYHVINLYVVQFSEKLRLT